MNIKNYLMGLSISLIIYSQITLADISCTQRTTCQNGETCIFSQSQGNDSHIASCGYFSTQLCCTNIASLNIRNNTCNTGETIVLSYFQQNDTHVSVNGGDLYNNTICITGQGNIEGTTISTRTSCNSDENPMFSVYNYTNSHVAQPNYFQYNVCAKVKATSGQSGGSGSSGGGGIETFITNLIPKETIQTINATNNTNAINNTNATNNTSEPQLSEIPIVSPFSIFYLISSIVSFTVNRYFTRIKRLVNKDDISQRKFYSNIIYITLALTVFFIGAFIVS